MHVSSATFELKAASFSAMASSGVFHPRVLRGRRFIRRATSPSSVWRMVLRSVPFGDSLAQQTVGVLIGAARPVGMRIAEPDVDLQPSRQFRVAGHLAATVVSHLPTQHGGQAFHLAGSRPVQTDPSLTRRPLTASLQRDNQDENPASIRMRTRVWGHVGRA